MESGSFEDQFPPLESPPNSGLSFEAFQGWTTLFEQLQCPSTSGNTKGFRTLFDLMKHLLPLGILGGKAAFV